MVDVLVDGGEGGLDAVVDEVEPAVHPEDEGGVFPEDDSQAS